jgi:hypothetical protein
MEEFQNKPISSNIFGCVRAKREDHTRKKNAKHKTSSYNKNIATDSFTLFQTSPLDAK